MSGNKLDQSLDQIMTDARKSAPRRNVRRAKGGAVKAVAPSAGVKKNTRAPKPAPKIVAPITAMPTGKGKITVTNLPHDVNEKQIQDFFQTTGKIEKVMLAYGPDGKSRGQATITFREADGAVKAASKLDGIKIDGRPLKIEVVVAAKHVPGAAAPKSLAERATKAKPVVKGKDKPKPVTAARPAKKGAAVVGKAAARSARGGRSGRAGRPKPKTQEELDAEMQDYWTTTSGAAPQPAGGAMEDTIA